jgi:predicted enzyme related to lactoylglutathione lyase
MLRDTRTLPTIPASDMATMRSFYKDTLGLHIREEGDTRIVFECADGTAVVLFRSDGRAAGTHTQMVFASTDFDADIADLRSRGITSEIIERPGVRMAPFQDPEGNLLALSSMPEALLQ